MVWRKGDEGGAHRGRILSDQTGDIDQLAGARMTRPQNWLWDSLGRLAGARRPENGRRLSWGFCGASSARSFEGFRASMAPLAAGGPAKLRVSPAPA